MRRLGCTLYAARHLPMQRAVSALLSSQPQKL
jgi:hypothetical protein